MAITLDGTTGISSVDGSASSPSVRGSDSNSGIVYAADAIKFSTGGTERVVIDNNGLNPAGHILQVKQTVNSAQASDSLTVNTWDDIAGLSVSITPVATSSKILVSYKAAVSSTKGGYTTYLQIVRGSTAVGIGDATGGRPRVTTYIATGATDYSIEHHTNMFLDSPSTTSATTYKLQWMSSYSGQTFYLNRSINNTDGIHYPTQMSQITVMEVGG
tara:strand:+ start:78 stop:725 length:648 start_codon:yes stop_codon:yes gene_type:complete